MLILWEVQNKVKYITKQEQTGTLRIVPYLALPGYPEILNYFIEMFNPDSEGGTIHPEISLQFSSLWNQSSVTSVTWSQLLSVLLLSCTVLWVWKVSHGP